MFGLKLGVDQLTLLLLLLLLLLLQSLTYKSLSHSFEFLPEKLKVTRNYFIGSESLEQLQFSSTNFFII